MILLIFGCLPNKSPLDESGGSPVDADQDGYVHWEDAADPSVADCDDQDPDITPENLIYIPAGDFPRGANQSDDASPMEAITLSAYCIHKYEQSNAQFALFMNTQRQMGYPNQTIDGQPLFDFEDNDDEYPERILDNGSEYLVMTGYSDHPVVEIYKWSASSYCQFHNMSLPTEAQWEKAARGTTENIFPWGNTPATCELANFWPRQDNGQPAERCVDDTAPVDSYPQGVSPYGVYNMAGNVSEWVFDLYQPDYYQQSPQVDPQGPSTGWAQDQNNPDGFAATVSRGGSLGSGDGSLRTFHRVAEPLEATSNGLGFRCVMNLDSY